ncbi:glycosyltransferase [Flavobacterium ajazii]|uniref:glycosyltransferase n=1 Tax=Flavobacterium ajazii TaxID=2692318 RepID=UPI0013D7B36D|nr:glycosyltransferase [Flavobacterium ajazii]
MRIVQLIDSLEAGGAERMALNYAIVLANTIDFSGLVATRKEGSLKNEIPEKVSYLFLKKKNRIDCKAIFKLRKYLVENKIDYLQAHSSSFFLAVLLKFTLPKIKIVWHDHYGKSEFLIDRPHKILRYSSLFFEGIISVNQNLKDWSEKFLLTKKVIYSPNFPLKQSGNKSSKTILYGEKGKRIVCLANLRPQKNHELLLLIAEKIKEKGIDWTFHLVGKDFEDDYAQKIKTQIVEKQLQEQVFLYGSCSDVNEILNQCQIGILTSVSEGLPVALLEYGREGLAVVSTDVGQIGSVVVSGENGFLVSSNDPSSFAINLERLIKETSLRNEFSSNLKQTIDEEFSGNAIIMNYLSWIKKGIENE